MKKSSTPRLLSEKAIVPVLTPKSSTVELLKQFARSYTYESKLSQNIGGYILN